MNNRPQYTYIYSPKMFDNLPRASCHTWISKILFVLTIISAVVANTQVFESILQRRIFCSGKSTCHDCIQTPDCAWCSSPSFGNPRCFLPGVGDESTLAQCSEEFVWNPDTVLTILRNKKPTGNSTPTELSSPSSPSSVSDELFADHTIREIVQLSPQELNLQLRIHQDFHISFSYTQAEDFPVDLYYLPIFGQSVDTANSNLIKLWESLALSMRNITRNYQLGFGRVDPILLTTANEERYNFRSLKPLSVETGDFVNELRNSQVSDDSDTVTAGPDTIMQVVLSSEDINWRSNAKKLLIFATDNKFPQNTDVTFDTIVGNIIVPQINNLANQKGINIIWVIMEEQYDNFTRISNSVEGSSVQILSNNSDAVIDLIKSHYANISTSVIIKDTATSNVRIKYFSDSLEDGVSHETSVRNGLKVGTKVQFIAKIGAIECPKDQSQWNQQFYIYPVGVAENLTVNLQLLCDCECENPLHHSYQSKSPLCMEGGTLKCGICDCDHDRFGKHCECQSQEVMMIQDSCNMPDNNSSVVCSGRGSCICGICECELRSNLDEIISGRYCECDNFSCDRVNGLICSGHGSCVCGQCVCEPHWTGSACDCRTSQETCVAPVDAVSVLCSGHGQCVCGACICDHSDNTHYSGRFCDKDISSL